MILWPCLLSLPAGWSAGLLCALSALNDSGIVSARPLLGNPKVLFFFQIYALRTPGIFLCYNFIMNRVITHPQAGCRHEKYGHCSNELWNIMKSSGKPGLNGFFCTLWRARMEALNRHHEAAWRAGRFGLTGVDRQKAVELALARMPAEEPCPDFRPEPDDSAHRCRFYFLEACLLRFPICRPDCNDYLPSGDQHG